MGSRRAAAAARARAGSARLAVKQGSCKQLGCAYKHDAPHDKGYITRATRKGVRSPLGGKKATEEVDEQGTGLRMTEQRLRRRHILLQQLMQRVCKGDLAEGVSSRRKRTVKAADRRPPGSMAAPTMQGIQIVHLGQAPTVKQSREPAQGIGAHPSGPCRTGPTSWGYVESVLNVIATTIAATRAASQLPAP